MVVNSSPIERKITFGEKNETSEFFLSEICLMVIWPGLMEYTRIPSVYNYFLQLFNSIKTDNLEYQKMLAGPVYYIYTCNENIFKVWGNMLKDEFGVKM